MRLLDNLVRQAGKEGIGDVGQEQAQGGGRPVLQLPGRGARVVTEGLHHVVHAAPGRRRHRARARIEDPGDDGDGHPRRRGNIADGRLLLHVYSSIGYCGSPEPPAGTFSD